MKRNKNVQRFMQGLAREINTNFIPVFGIKKGSVKAMVRGNTFRLKIGRTIQVSPELGADVRDFMVQLELAINANFKGVVVDVGEDEGEYDFSLGIGPRDIQVDEKGELIGAGTFIG